MSEMAPDVTTKPVNCVLSDRLKVPLVHSVKDKDMKPGDDAGVRYGSSTTLEILEIVAAGGAAHVRPIADSRNPGGLP
jgi:hypothetical protein